MDEGSVTRRCQLDDDRGRARSVWKVLRLTRLALPATVAAAVLLSALGPSAAAATTALPLSAAQQRDLERGVAAAHACEGEIDGDLGPYVACIEHRLSQRGLPRAELAGLRLQAWLMADLALQQSTPGAVAARTRWWQALQTDLKRSRMTLEQLCVLRQLSCDDVRMRAARTAPP
jgi:hypothetical protein